MGLTAQVCRRLRWLPRWLAGTALTGQSGLFDRFCVASQGYKDFFVEHGIEARKIGRHGHPELRRLPAIHGQHLPPPRLRARVHLRRARDAEARRPRRASFDARSTLANGRRVIFKLHPNEGPARADEIRALAPGALVYASGSAEEMIANADVVITQWSSTAFVGARARQGGPLRLPHRGAAPPPADPERRPVRGEHRARVPRGARVEPPLADPAAPDARFASSPVDATA